MKHWWDTFPGRIEHEYACLDVAGVRYALDEAAADSGVLQLRVTRIDDVEVDVTATFPDLYPFFRPAVQFASDVGNLTHHVHPMSRDLCLLGRDTAAWQPQDTLAWLLTKQLPKAISAGEPGGADRSDLAAVEEQQAEPYSDYYQGLYAEDGLILVDGGWDLPAGTVSGDLQVGFRSVQPDIDGTPEGGGTLGAVLSVADESEVVLASLSGQAHERFPHLVRGRWVRLTTPLLPGDVEGMWAAARSAANSSLDGVRWVRFGFLRDREVAVVGVVFPEERGHRRTGDGWVFFMRVRRAAPPGQGPRRGKGGRAQQVRSGPTTSTHLVAAGFAGRSDLADRVPELTGLHEKHVLVLGVGALGGTVVEHLARAGVGELTIFDRDRLEPGNLVRHAAPWPLVGWSKARAGVEIARNAAPDMAVTAGRRMIGGVRVDGEGAFEPDELARHIDAADLVLDCTAEKGVQQAFGWLTARRGKPFITASATNGAWGGRVARFTHRPGHGCWSCLEHALDDGSIPVPPSAPHGSVQPPGCAEPTFTGSGFDLAEVALQTVRVAVSVLQEQAGSGYPNYEHDVHVLSLRDPLGGVIPPFWTGFPLSRHGSCSADHA